VQGDPRYVDITPGLGAGSSANDLHLQSASPAIGAALNLSALYTSDKDGAARPAAPAAWDAGAYEFGGIAAAVVVPAVTAPAVTSPAVVDPVVATPVVADPTVADPVATLPVVAPVATVPVDPAPAIAASDVTAPAATTPLVVAPAATPTGSAPAASRLINFSVRAFSSVGANTLIAGFAVNGASKQILMRAVGPGLAQLGVTGYLTAPQISLQGTGIDSEFNAAWGGTTALTDAFSLTGAFALNPASLDAALLSPLPVGAYTAEVTSGNGSGVAMAELYDADAAPSPAGSLSNFSGRAWVGTGSNILIAGFAIAGTAPETVLIRGVGPSLAQLGVTGYLANPQIDLYQNSTLLQHNDNWGGSSALTAAFAQVGAFPFTSTQDAAMIVTLQPGQYSVQVSGVGGTTGVALVEVYQLQ